MAKNLDEKEVKPVRGISSEAVAIFEIAKDVLAEARQGKNVFLIHMPRGATPIVDGINQIAAKMVKGKKPYEIVKIPYSRENLPKQAVAREIFSNALAKIPRNATVFYVDEVITGRVPSANAEDLQKLLKRKGSRLKVHLVVADAGRALSKTSKISFKSTNANIALHKIPGRISWSDKTTVLGYNWGLLHRFPEEILLRALGNNPGAKKAIQPLKREYLQRYEKLVRLGKEKKFREVLHSNPFYAMRQMHAIQAFKEAVEATGFGKKHKVEFSRDGVKVGAKFIPFWNLGSFVFDNHPRTEAENLSAGLQKRAAYKRLLQSDPNLLVDIRPVSPESRVNSRRLKRELSRLWQKHPIKRRRK